MDSSYKILVDAKLKTSTIQSQLSEISKSFKGINVDSSSIDKMNSKVSQSTGFWKSLSGGILDTTAKVIKFGAITSVIDAFTTAVSDSVKAVFDLNASLVDFQKVSDLSGDSLDAYVDKLGKLGDSVARTTNEMVQNATIFKQAGYSDADAATLSKLAAEYQNVADSEISAQEAGSFIVSQMKAYNLTAENATVILDQLNEV